MSSQKKKQRTGKKVKQYPAFSLGPTFIPYLSALAACFVFTQEVRSTLSAVLFWFLAALPAVCLIYVICCCFAISAEARANSLVLDRLQELHFYIKLKNKRLLPIGHVEADVSFPNHDGATVSNIRVSSTLPPFGESVLSDTLVVPFHGRLPLAVEQLYIYDFFRLFRLRRRVRQLSAIEILPRDITLQTALNAPSQEYAGQVEHTKRGFERSEQTDVRTYHVGDPVKDIHWKLSARSEELIVREYDRTSGQRFYAIADYSDYFRAPTDATAQVFPDTIGRTAASGVAELSQALLSKALDAGYDCHAVFRSSVDAKTEEIRVVSEDVHRALFRRLTYQASDATPTDVTALALSLPEIHHSAVCFVLSHVTEEMVKQIQRFSALHTGQFLGRVSVYYYDCSPQILLPEYKERFLRYQMKLLGHLTHIMEVQCVREQADGTFAYYHPSSALL